MRNIYDVNDIHGWNKGIVQMKTTKPNLCEKMMTDKSVRIVILLREFARNGTDRSARINDKTIDIANLDTTRVSPLQMDGSRILCLHVNVLNRDGVVEIVLENRFSYEKDTQRRETCKFCHSGRNFCAIHAKLVQVWHYTYLFIYKLQA